MMQSPLANLSMVVKSSEQKLDQFESVTPKYLPKSYLPTLPLLRMVLEEEEEDLCTERFLNWTE